MNCLSHVSPYTTAIFGTQGRFVATSFLYGQLSWKIKLNPCVGIQSTNLVPPKFHVHLYSTRSNVSSKNTPCRSRAKPAQEPVVDPERDAFFVVRKGDIVGVYKSFSDCQAQLSASIFDPPVSVYKGYSLHKDTEEYLESCGLKNAVYTIRAADLKDDLFGKLLHCPFQEAIGSTFVSQDPLREHIKIDHLTKSPAVDSGFCILEFDGASKGNPGLAGAGAVLRADNGSLICKVHEGLGIRTNNVAEYRALILGLKYALKKGFTKIRAKGDSKLVCMQVQGLWRARNQNMSELCEEVKELKDKFLSFQISHVLRELNSEADEQANLAVRLTDGQVQEEEFGK